MGILQEVQETEEAKEWKVQGASAMIDIKGYGALDKSGKRLELIEMPDEEEGYYVPKDGEE